MSNNITIELCAEDRARLDRLYQVIEAQINVTQYLLDKGIPMEPKKVTTEDSADDIKKALAEVVERGKPTIEETVEAKNTTQDEPKEETPTIITPTEEEKPTVEESAEPTPVRTVSRAELSTKVRELMTKGHKEQVKEIVKSYAPTVPAVPDDKVTECYDRLVALEG